MKQKKRFTLPCLLTATLLLCGCAHTREPSPEPQAVTDTPPSVTPSGVISEVADMGQAYVDRFLFFGESTTYHLKSRGVLSGGTETTQVWAPKSGTVCLDEGIVSLRIVYPETGEELTLAQALEKKKPQRMLLTFGLNGAVKKYTRGREYFQSCYRMLIDLIRSASPDTEIFLGSCFPVAANMDTTNYSVDVRTVNEYLNTLNGWSRELAAEEGLGYLDFASKLKDDGGFLKAEYQVGDGIHLTAEAYRTVLRYIRTHDGSWSQD